jgi:hypothetical protein
VIDVLLLALAVSFAINWITFAVVWLVARQHRDIRALNDRRWISFGIALGTTGLVVLGINYYARIPFGPVLNTLLLVVPIYVLTAVNVVFLVLTARGRW